MNTLRHIYTTLHEPKTTIGWAHGLVACFGAFGLSYLCGMSFSLWIYGDMAQRLFPSMFLFPLAVCGIGYWLLFSKTLFHALVKVGLCIAINVCLIVVGWSVI